MNENKPIDLTIHHKDKDFDLANLTIKDIEPTSFGGIIKNKQDLEKAIEKPLLEACEIFYDKNIKTTQSTANAKDIGRNALIAVDYNSLSLENQKIANNILDITIGKGGRITATVKIPIENANTPVKEISDKTVEIANQFKKQPLTWTEITTWKEKAHDYGFSSEEECRKEYAPGEFPGYYDKENGVFFPSREHYDKLKETPEVFAKMVKDAKERIVIYKDKK